MKIIIVPTDFSENAVNAVKYAIGLSKMHYNKLIFTHVYSLPFLNPEAGMVYDQSFFEAQRIQADKALREHIDKVYESMGMHRNLILSELEVVEAISLSGGIEKIHHKYNSNMVIMGTHGATGLKKFFLGSNAVDVLENIDIPVLTVPEQWQFKDIRNIAYASDFNEIDTELKQVVNFSKAFNAAVNVIHIASDNSKTQFLENDPLLTKWQQICDYQKINLHYMQKKSDDSLQDALKMLLKETDADILVMFHQHHNFWKSLFEKSTTAEIVYEWTAPVLTMRKK
jgi:nucleotide-binding universal stress UspA family protein